MSENASIIQATSLMAGNGVVLLKVHDTLVTVPAPPLVGRLILIAMVILPPFVGLACAFLNLTRMELGIYNRCGRLENVFHVFSMLGIVAPICLWVIQIAIGR